MAGGGANHSIRSAATGAWRDVWIAISCCCDIYDANLTATYLQNGSVENLGIRLCP
ncbi:uncharacterized protein LACBIDRAFT_305490 [Laccaria bicolor S238N-H82]|uniref:Predicted protein n=1 Tax=Laccaria bicolor (strain S238N-H82 / ATCC MYA-4686) TaxID=486041 RepID=B0CUD1_LACBS|nr:uncharacterized protein LACBIDRAFT_305490 [Laccaria bicolor S238N-H82]EDR14074.1 predicted protein [Laccaria bicolor S238N-H82]|eukprot:XP_001874633.1 predicted protein [Laccaria bicolor S238N-H82]